MGPESLIFSYSKLAQKVLVIVSKHTPSKRLICELKSNLDLGTASGGHQATRRDPRHGSISTPHPSALHTGLILGIKRDHHSAKMKKQ
jgi:hypothetical protein